MNRDDIEALSYEERLSELAKDAAKNERLNLSDYYQLLEWAKAYTLAPVGSDASEGAVGFEIGGIHYILLFMRQDVASDVGQRCENAVAVPVAARDALMRVPVGWGVIVDWGTSAELTLPPTSILEFNERFRIWPVKQEATEDWLVNENASMAARGVNAERRVAEAMNRWAELNGFPVLAESRRARRTVTAIQPDAHPAPAIAGACSTKAILISITWTWSILTDALVVGQFDSYLAAHCSIASSARPSTNISIA